VTPGATIATSVLTVYSSGLAFTDAHPAKHGSMFPLEGIAFATVIFVPFFSFKRGVKRSKAAIRAILAILSVIAVVSFNGCSSTTQSTPTPATYTITVTGTSNQLVHSTSITLTLQSLQ
jgi:hypothetical protein